MNPGILTRGAVSMFPADIIRKYGDMYCDWSDAVEEKFNLFRPNAKLKRFVSRIVESKTALVLGAGLSSTTGPFMERWKEYENIYDALTNDPEQVEGFVELYSWGGVKVQPKFGNGMIPDLVRAGLVSSLLIFNYNCHVQYCLTLCRTGYQSLVYCGEKEVEQTTVGKPKCRIFKPHGSARLTEKPTKIIWPKKQLGINFSVCEEFVADVKNRGVKQILILGWSARFDSHIRPYLVDLKKSGVSVIHVGLPHHTDESAATVGWGVLDEYVLDYEEGGIDVLYGLAKEIGVDTPCILDDDPLTRLSNNLQAMRLERSRFPLTS
ncbi:MAG: hypothetical protein JSW05_02275 [Candidatus Thorarchaeota archaeon]|nr:MAG: hypothetical protein JSW05_02275 [Candidatus Thorarchaeota archaeon]